MTNRFSDFRALTLLLALLAFALCGAPGAFAADTQPITFHFKPPEGIVVIQTDNSTTVEKMNDKTRSEEVDDSKMRVGFHKTATGYTAVLTNLANTLKRDGKVVHSPEAALMKDVVLTYVLDAAGKCKTVKGFDVLQRRMAAEMNQQRAANHLPAAKKQATELASRLVSGMVKQRVEEWQMEFSRFSGKTVKLGDTWRDSTPLSLPVVGALSIKFTLHHTITFAERVTVNGHQCVRLKYLTTTDPVEVKTAIKQAMSTLKQMAEKQHVTEKLPEMQDFSLQQLRERVIDPATMLVYSESYSQTQRTQLDHPTKGKVVALTTEQRTTKYEFK